MEAIADIEGGVRQAIARIQTTPFVPQSDRVRGGVRCVRAPRRIGLSIGLAL